MKISQRIGNWGSRSWKQKGNIMLLFRNTSLPDLLQSKAGAKASAEPMSGSPIEIRTRPNSCLN